MAAKEKTKAILESITSAPALPPPKKHKKGLEGSAEHRRGLEDVEEIRKASHFNFIKMHLLTHYREHVELFGNVPMFSTDMSELAHKDQIKDSYRSSNKVDATIQILDIFSRRQVIWMRVINLKAIADGSQR